MKHSNQEVFGAVISLALVVAPAIFAKAKASREEKKRIKDENIFVLNDTQFSVVK